MIKEYQFTSFEVMRYRDDNGGNSPLKTREKGELNSRILRSLMAPGYPNWNDQIHRSSEHVTFLQRSAWLCLSTMIVRRAFGQFLQARPEHCRQPIHPGKPAFLNFASIIYMSSTVSSRNYTSLNGSDRPTQK